MLPVMESKANCGASTAVSTNSFTFRLSGICTVFSSVAVAAQRAPAARVQSHLPAPKGCRYLRPMVASIELRITDGDVLDTGVDLVCFKHAQSFYGADAVAVRRLTASGHFAEHEFEVQAGQVKVVATGGLAGVIAPECETVQHVDEALTLKGMRLLWETRAGRTGLRSRRRARGRKS